MLPVLLMLSSSLCFTNVHKVLQVGLPIEKTKMEADNYSILGSALGIAICGREGKGAWASRRNWAVMKS